MRGVAATRLSFECETILSNLSTESDCCDRPERPTNLSVTFDEHFSLPCCDPEAQICTTFHASHGKVQECIHTFQNQRSEDDAPLSNDLAVLSSLAEDFDLLEPFLMQQAAHKQHQPAICDLSIVFSDATWLLSVAEGA